MNISNKAKVIIAGLLAIIVACGIGFSDNLFKSNAVSTSLSDLKDISTLKNSEKITDSTEIPADYTFYPKIQKDENGNQITRATTFGDWDLTDADTIRDDDESKLEGVANVVWIDPGQTTYNGKIGMIYDNVGTYNGHTIKMKATYMGSIGTPTTNGFGLIMYNNTLGIRTSASPYGIKIKYEFFDAETDKPIVVKGYQVFADIDAHQGFQLDKYDKIYYSEGAQTKNLKIANFGSGLENVIQSTISQIYEDPEDITKVAYTFTGSELSYTWTSSMCYYNNLDPDHSYQLVTCYKNVTSKAQMMRIALNVYYYVDSNNNVCSADTEGATKKSAVLTLRTSSTKMIPSETKDPLKSISDTNGDTITKDTYNKTDKFYFSVLHEVPGESSNNYYTSYVIKDKLDPALQVTASDVHIYNDATKDDITSKFDVSITEENGAYVVSAAAKAEELSKSSFYTKAYNMVIGVSVKNGYDLSNYYSNGYYHINNIANVLVNNKQKDSNETTVKITENPVLAIEKTADKENYNIGDTANYTVKVSETAQNATAKNVVITDTLDNSNATLVANSILIKDKNGNNLDVAQISTSGNSYTIKTNSNLSYGEYFTVSYRVRLNNDALGGQVINNTATAKADNASDVNAEETINVLEPVVYTPELTIKKSVNKTKFSVGDTATYTLKVSQTVENAVAENVVIKDTFDTNLVSASNIQITNSKGLTVNSAEITQTEDGFVINTHANLEKGEYFTVRYDVVLSSNSTAGKTINNTAVANADNAADVTDNAKITVAKPVLTITKKVNKTTYSVGDKVTYTLKVTQTADGAVAKNVVITDTFDTNLIEPTNIKITDTNGNTVNNAEIIKNDTGFTINTHSNLAKDEYFTVVYSAALSDNSLAGKTINNVATAVAEMTEQVEDNATINVIKPALEITKDVNKTAFSTNDKATYTLKVRQTVENAVAKNVVITDTLDTSLASAENIKITDKNGNEVNAADIVQIVNGFQINTNSNLAYDEFFTITYTVMLSNAELSGKEVTNVAKTHADNADEVDATKTITITKPALTIEKTSDKSVYSTGETAKYTLVVKQTVENAVAKNVIIKDSFDNENLSKPTNIKILDSKGNSVTNAEISVEDRGFTIYTNSNLAYNETFTVTYNVNMASAALSGQQIKNVAVADSENTEETTTENTVTVTTPALAIIKEVNKTAFSSSETARYTLKVSQTVENAVAKNVVITDAFDNENISKPSNIKITDAKGEEVSSADINVSETGFTINTHSDLAYEEFFTVTYTVNLSNPALAGATVNNIANAVADNAEQVEDNATITIGKPNLEIVKTSNKDLYGTDEHANYTIKVTQTVQDATALNVVVSDIFDNDKVSIIEKTIKVKDKDGNEITSAQIEKTEKGYVIKTFTNLEYNESLTITYTANLANDELAGKEVKNTATATSDNTPEKTVDKIIKIVAPILSIEKTSDQAAYLLGSTAKYTVKVTQTVENAIAKEVSITDLLSNEKAKILKDTIKITDTKGNEISGVEIRTTDDSYQILTHKNLAYNEQFIITYSVDLKDASLNNTDVINTATALSKTTETVKTEHTVKVSDNKSVVNKINTDAKVQTGNNLPIALFAFVAILSLIGIGASVAIRKKK